MIKLFDEYKYWEEEVRRPDTSDYPTSYFVDLRKNIDKWEKEEEEKKKKETIKNSKDKGLFHL